MEPRPKIGRTSQMVFHGKPLTSGIARGKSFLLKRVDIEQLRKNKKTVVLISSELARLDFAVNKSKEQITHYMGAAPPAKDDPSYQIFEAALCLLCDPLFISPLSETILRTSLRGESVLAEEIAQLRDKAIDATDEFSLKNLVTMQDLYFRVLYNLLPTDEDRISSLMEMPTGSILIANRLTPVEVAVVPMDKVVGILIEESTQNSHAAIMARTLGVPVIIDFQGIGSPIEDSSDMLVDAYRGLVFLNPAESTVKECLDVENRHKAAALPAVHPADDSSAQSADGVTMHLSCNASALADILLAHNQGIPEIGLFRSEMRYLANTVQPSDENEAAYYTGIFGVEGIKSMTVRLLDMGGDKLPVYMQMAEETDPQLGCRGIRFLLSRPDLMKKQVRAILVAQGTFQIRLLLPFIATVDDFLKSREIIEEVFAEMNVKGDVPPIGIMIEIPSVALSIERFLPKVDFVCLGTNDLIQYFFAANRDQNDLQKYNRFSHPAFLKMVKNVIFACKSHGKPITACGEMASDPLGCCLLMALGVVNLSIQPDAIQQVRHTVSRLDVVALRHIMPVLYNLDSADAVEQKIATIVNR